MMKNNHYRAAAVIYTAALTLVSVKPISCGGGPDMARQALNNALHVPAYGILTFLLIKSAPDFKHIYISSFLFSLIFGVFNEYLQTFVPARCASGSDVVLNGIGSLSVILFCIKRYAPSPEN